MDQKELEQAYRFAQYPIPIEMILMCHKCGVVWVAENINEDYLCPLCFSILCFENRNKIN